MHPIPFPLFLLKANFKGVLHETPWVYQSTISNNVLALGGAALPANFTQFSKKIIAIFSGGRGGKASFLTGLIQSGITG